VATDADDEGLAGGPVAAAELNHRDHLAAVEQGDAC
jgi:hypothetical protein